MNETDSPAYREFPPPAELRRALACLWVRRGSGPVRVLPDGCVDIVWRLAEGAVVAGPDTGPWHSDTEPGELISVGYGPKILQRILRLRRFLAGQRYDLARAAHDAGYADQAHLTRECLRLTGISPSRLP